MTSAYPTPMDKLTEQVRSLATEQGTWPSLRQIKQRCNVGHPKAVDALEALRTSGFDPANPDGPTTPATVTVAERRLRAVPASAAQDAPTDDDDQAEQDQAEREPETAVAVSEPVPTEVETSSVATDAAEGTEVVSTVAEPAVITATVPVAEDATPAPQSAAEPTRTPGRWRNLPVYLIALGAFVAIWGGWVGLGQLTGFGPVNLLPGIGGGWTINTAITLPLGMEAYAAFAMRIWLDHTKPTRARRFAMWSTCAALLLGMSGQVAYHLMQAAGMTAAPWQITTFVSCLPVLVLGGAAALVHLSHDTSEVHS